MDVKDLRTEPALSERNNNGSKYTQGGGATLQCNRSKSYQDIGSNPLAKAEGVPVRPCAVIGPDRVVPPPTANDTFLKKGPVEPWPSPDNGYRRPPDYPHRLHQNPARNISPRQTFQENMQRINVPPTYNAVRHSDSANFNHFQDRSVAISKNAKPNMAPEAKYCDVPYAINTLANEPKNVRDSDMYVSSANSQLTRSAPHVWPPGSVNVNASRTYSANEPYPYQQYASCAGQRPPVIPMARPHRTIQEDPAYVYPDHYYRDAIGRLKPYPPMKERCPQPMYEYVGNYAGQFHPPPPIQPLKYDIPKSGQTHPYPVFPHFKYLDNRVPDPNLEGYQRSSTHQSHYNLPFRTQVIHPTYAQAPGGAPAQKVPPYPSDGSVKSIPSNKLHYDNSSKMYIDYDNTRNKPYPMADNYYANEMNRFHPLKNQMVMPNYSSIGMRAMPSQQYYIKDNTPMKPFEYMPTFRNFDPHLTGNPVLRHAPQFSPNTLAISPTDSSTSNDTSHTHGTSQEDCGYVSQSSNTSVRSIDSGVYRLPHEYYKRHDFRYSHIVGNSHTLAKTDLNSKETKQNQINVRQFLQMWNEGEEENNSENNNSKEIIIPTSASDMGNFPKHAKTEDQLYVLGLVNVSSEDLSKYEHIEKISKLPENIKGYNNLELFSRFEEAMESCNTTAFKTIPKEYQSFSKDSSNKVVGEALPRSMSPLDVEAKISQSVIHKEVGCNFEIKPCSPKMLNVEVAAPARNILGERIIEKVTNPLSKVVKSPLPIKSDENSNCHAVVRQDNVFAITDNNPSCKMIRSPYSSNNMDSVKTNYMLQDVEINSGVCLASLPRLDNEIELNFPEVNQQFINANKKDGFSTANNCHQSNFQENSSLSENREDKADSETSKIMLTECDKTFNKLSKYRKSKTNATDISEHQSKAVRTDSVIIKNPENIENKMLENSLNIPMNLSSQSQWYDSPHEQKEKKDNDIALDFSLNKSGNDLPLIEIEKDALIKPLQINHSHLSREKVLSTDTNAYCQESAFMNDITENSKLTVESIEPTLNKVSCVRNYQDLSLKTLPTSSTSYKESSYTNDDVVNPIIQTYTKAEVHNSTKVENKPDDTSYEVIKSTVPKKETGTSVSDSTLPDSLIFENAELENKNYDADQHAHTKSKESQEIVQKYTDENTVVLDGKIIDNDILEIKFENSENPTIPQTESVLNNEIENVKQFFSPEEYSPLNKTELLVTPQKENDFEHDEISVSLEKLFRESNEDILLKENDKYSLSVSGSKPSKQIGCHQSKELYSPTIQKLLTHSEGSCSCKELPHKGIIKSIFDPDEYIDTPVQSGMEFFEDKLGQNPEISHNKTIASTLHIKRTKLITETKNLTSDTIPKPESNTINHTPDNVIDSISKIHGLFDVNNEPQDTTRILIVEHDMVDVNKLCIEKESHQIINDKKMHSKVVVDTKPRKIKKHKLHTLKLPKRMSSCDKKYLANVSVNSKIDTNDCKNSMSKIETETIVSRKSMCDLESVIQNDLTVAISKNVLDFVSDDKEEQTSEHNDSKIILTERLLTNDNSYSNNSTFQPDAMIQEKFSVEIVSSNAFNEYQVGENLSKDQVIENIFEDRNKDKVEKIITFDSCTDDSSVLKTLSYLSSESLSKSVSGIFTEHQEQKPFTDIALNDSGDMMDDKIQISDICSVILNNSSKLRNSVSNNCSNHGIKESKSLEHLDDVTGHCAKEVDKASGLLNITSKDFKYAVVVDKPKSIADNVSVDNCISYQANDNHSELIAKCNSDEDSQKELDTSKCTNSICDYHVVSLENKNIQSLVKKKCNKSDSNIHQMSKTLESLEDVSTVNNAIQEDHKIVSDIDSDFHTENITETKLVGNTVEDHDVMSETLDNANKIISKEVDKFEESQYNITSETLSSRDSKSLFENKLQETQNGQNTIKNGCESVAEVESHSSAVKSDFTDIQVKESKNLINLPRISNNHIKTEAQKNTIQDYLLANNDIGKEATLNICGRTQNTKFDFEANEHCSYSNANDHGVNDIYIKRETKDETDKKNNTVLKEIDLHMPISSEECDNSNNSEPNSLDQENENDNTLSNLSKWTEDYNEQTTLSSKLNITVTDEEYVSSENEKVSTCDPITESNLAKFENHLANVHHQETSIQEYSMPRRLTLKRSFSDSALNNFKNRDTPDKQLLDSTPMWPPKRQKMYEIDHSEQQAIDENFCNFIQNRRNSISSFYNAENVSFCILIDNDCILTEENEVEKICFAEVSEDCITELDTAEAEDNTSEVICGPKENELNFSDSVMLGYDSEKSIQESWLDDVACVETVVSDDIVEDIDNDVPGFSGDVEVSNYDDSEIFNSSMSELTHGVNFINEETVQDNVSDFENTYESQRDDDKIMLYDGETQFTNNYNVLYNGQCMEKILPETYRSKCSPSPTSDYSESIPVLPDDTEAPKLTEDKENIFVKNMTLQNVESESDENSANGENNFSEDIDQTGTTSSLQNDKTMHLSESSVDNLFGYNKQDDDVSYSTSTSSSSPEVSSTTFEEKSSSILLKITNYNGSRVSEINEINRNRPRCKFTESKDYSNLQGGFPKRPLITKAAQKYIPPLKESIRDLKVKLPLPQQRLLKLKQLKLAKSEPKVVKQNILTIPKKKKPKPNFEDVLKNIDEVQIKMHKQNSKKIKTVVPKVVIKKNVNGSHYTSSSSKEKFNPDLTGRKWQPWVFLERNRFIDNMATRNKTKAIFSHRKNMYVLTEKFKKYKAVSNCSTKFVISQPKTGNSSKGQLKYTIRLKHS